MTLAGLPGVNQTNLGVFKTYATAAAVTAGSPNITLGGVNVPTGIIPISAPNFTNQYYSTLSVDYNISSKDSFRGRLIYNKSDAINTVANLPVFFSTVPGRFYVASLAEYHTFTPSLTNEFRLGYQRQNSSSPVGDQKFPGLDAFPNLQFNNLNLQIGPNPNYPQATIVNLYQGTDNLTWIKGKHTFKFGGEFRRYISPQQFTQRVRGDYQYTNVANYLFDLTPDFLAQRNIGNAIYYGDQKAVYTFVQDTWRIRQNLTLDIGARYEYTTVPVGIQSQKLNSIASVPGLLEFHAPTTSPKGLAPRVGLAYTPDKSGNTVVRAGFGIAYDVIFDNVGLNSVPPEFSTTVDVTRGTATNFLQNGGITQSQGLGALTAVSARRATSAYIPDFKLPYSLNWNFGVQHVFAKDYTLEVRYLVTRGVHQILQTQLNRLSLVSPAHNIPTYLSTPSAATLASLPLTLSDLRAPGSLDPTYTNAGFATTITSYQPTGWNKYHGLSVQLNRRFANGLQYLAAYTWSHNIDNSTAEVASTYLTPRRPQDFGNLSAEKADSALDRRHRFTLSLIYEAAWYKSDSSWMKKNLLGNWQVAPIYTYEAPEYYTVQSGLDSNLNNDAATDRAIVNPSGTAHTASTVIGLDRNGNQIAPTASVAATNPIVAYVATNPNARYIQAGLGAYANGGRNTEATRPIQNVDLSLIKRFSFGEEHARFDVGAQGLNLFNHPQYIPGSINNTGLVNTFATSVLSYVQVSNPLFNNATKAFSSNPRTIQIFARFNW